MFALYALKQVVLSKFVRQMGDLLPSTLYISYLRMLKGLANGPQCAHYCFSLLKTNGATHSKSMLCSVLYINIWNINPMFNFLFLAFRVGEMN